MPASRMAEHALGGFHDVVKFLGNSKSHVQTSGAGVGVRTQDLNLLNVAAMDGGWNRHGLQVRLEYDSR